MESTFELTQSIESNPSVEPLQLDDIRNSKEDSMSINSWRKLYKPFYETLSSPLVSQIFSTLAESKKVGNIEDLKTSVNNLRISMALCDPSHHEDHYPIPNPTESNEFFWKITQGRRKENSSLSEIRASAHDIIELATQGKKEAKQPIPVTDNLITEILDQLDVKPTNVNDLIDFISIIKGDNDQDRTQRPVNFYKKMLEDKLRNSQNQVVELQNNLVNCQKQMKNFMDVIFQSMEALKDINTK